MPKKKQDKAKAAKLPREIAGVKISRELRSAIEPLLRFASHPLVSDTLASALLAGASALTAKKGGAAKKAKSGAKSAGKEASADPVGLMLAVAAGEIASRIVAAYQAPPGERRAAPADRRTSPDRRSGAGKPPTKDRRAGSRRVPTGDRRG